MLTWLTIDLASSGHDWIRMQGNCADKNGNLYTSWVLDNADHADGKGVKLSTCKYHCLRAGVKCVGISLAYGSCSLMISSGQTVDPYLLPDYKLFWTTWSGTGKIANANGIRFVSCYSNPILDLSEQEQEY